MSTDAPNSPLCKRMLREDWPLVALLAASWAYGLWALRQMPDRVPVHWNLYGEPDGWGTPTLSVIMLCSMATGTWLLLAAVPAIGPRGKALLEEGTSYRAVRWLVTGLMLGLMVIIITATLQGSTLMGGAIMALLGLFFMGFGNVMGRLPANYMVGIRTPWTLDDPEVWRAVHRSAGRLWFVGGGAIAALALVLDNATLGVIALALIGVMVAVPLVQSFVMYRKRHPS